jgi:hypothetical protein
MKDIKPRFFDHPDFCIRYLEWAAIKKLVFNGDGRKHHNYFEDTVRRSAFWTDHYTDNHKPKHTEIMTSAHDGTYKNIDEFYVAIDLLLKPKPKGKALKDKKKRTAQSAYQREKLGDAFIENDALISAAKACAYILSEASADARTIALKAAELVVMHNNNEALTEPQMTVLCDLIQQQIDIHQKPDNIESKIIDEDNKNLYFMWGKIKRKYPVNNTFAWPSKEAAKACGCSKTDVKPIMTRLEKLGAISLVQAGKPGKHSGRAAIYRREI